jgi:hypothetical protein
VPKASLVSSFTLKLGTACSAATSAHVKQHGGTRSVLTALTAETKAKFRSITAVVFFLAGGWRKEGVERKLSGLKNAVVLNVALC